MSEFEKVIKAISTIEDDLIKGAQDVLKKAGSRIAGTAKEKLGEYQPSVGEYPAWARLKPETIKQKNLTEKGKIKKSGKEYLKKYGSFAPSGTGDDGPLVGMGNLRRAITTDESEVEKGNIYIGVAKGKGEQKSGKDSKKKKGSDVSAYAAAHEFGSARQNIPPRPYLRPSVVENKENIIEDIKDGITSFLS